MASIDANSRQEASDFNLEPDPRVLPMLGEINSFSLSYTEGTTTLKSVTVATGKSVALTASAGFNIKVVNASLGVTVTETVNFTEQNSTTVGTSKTETENFSINHEIPPKTIYVERFEEELKSGYVDFLGVVRLEGEIFITLFNSATGEYMPNRIPFGMISDFLSEKEATVELRGELWNVSATATTRSFYEIPVSEHPGVCDGLVKSDDSIDEEKLLAQVFYIGNQEPIFDVGIKVVEPLFNGKVITTDVSAANVEVRAKSLGPGFCGTTISCPPGRSQILAPPLIWSSWTTLFSHLGSTSQSISVSTPGCSSVSEIRYFKKI